jgi:hypothetical protein
MLTMPCFFCQSMCEMTWQTPLRVAETDLFSTMCENPSTGLLSHYVFGILGCIYVC